MTPDELAAFDKAGGYLPARPFLEDEIDRRKHLFSAALAHARQQSCPHIVTSAEGTSYCLLADETGRKIQQSAEEIAALRAQVEGLRKLLEVAVCPACNGTETECGHKVHETHWFIECKEHFTGWWTGHTPLDCRFFDKNPCNAFRFSTKTAAEQQIRLKGNSCQIATEHIWVNKGESK